MISGHGRGREDEKFRSLWWLALDGIAMVEEDSEGELSSV